MRRTITSTPDRSQSHVHLDPDFHERQAFDWVGDRYNSGKVSDLLLDCLPEDGEWSDDGDITFDIPEHVAWQINELAEEEGYS